MNGSRAAAGLRFLLSAEGWPYLLVPFIPVAVALEFAHASATSILAASRCRNSARRKTC